MLHICKIILQDSPWLNTTAGRALFAPDLSAHYTEAARLQASHGQMRSFQHRVPDSTHCEQCRTDEHKSTHKVTSKTTCRRAAQNPAPVTQDSLQVYGHGVRAPAHRLRALHLPPRASRAATRPGGSDRVRRPGARAPEANTVVTAAGEARRAQSTCARLGNEGIGLSSKSRLTLNAHNPSLSAKGWPESRLHWHNSHGGWPHTHRKLRPPQSCKLSSHQRSKKGAAPWHSLSKAILVLEKDTDMPMRDTALMQTP